MRRIALASLGVLASAGIASAETLDGRWSLFAADCATEITDAVLTIDIPMSTLRYWESECTITSMTPVGTFEAVWQIQMSCSGEGDRWDREAIFAIDVPMDGDGTPRLVEIDLADGFVVSRAYCGPALPAAK